MELNVLGTVLESCCGNPATGYFRDGFCRTTDHDYGTHVVCAVVTEEFLEFTKKEEMIYQLQYHIGNFQD